MSERIERTVQPKRPVVSLSAPQVLRFLVTDDPVLDDLVIFKSTAVQIDMSQAALYAALVCVQPDDQFRLNKLAKLLEVAHVHHGHKGILTHEQVEQIRAKALKA